MRSLEGGFSNFKIVRFLEHENQHGIPVKNPGAIKKKLNRTVLVQFFLSGVELIC